MAVEAVGRNTEILISQLRKSTTRYGCIYVRCETHWGALEIFHSPENLNDWHVQEMLDCVWNLRTPAGEW